MSADKDDRRLASQPTAPTFATPDDPDQPALDFGAVHRKPYCINCVYCQGLHMTREDWRRCQVDATGGW